MERHMQTTGQTTGDQQAIDVLGTALMRATGVLSALTACQDQAKGNFALSGPFVLQAIAALEGFVNDARNAFFDLYAAGEAPTAKPARQPVAPAPFTPLAEPADHALFVTHDPSTVEGVLPDFYEIRRREAAAAPPPPGTDYQNTDDIAHTYDALLRKLTAAEVFAVEQGMGEDERSNPLLPLLKSLRSDLERIRAA